MTSGRHGKAWALAGSLSLALAGCFSRGTAPTAETEFLQSQLVPRILTWSSGSAASLPLAGLVQGRGYERLCVVREYGLISEIEDKGGGTIARYHSTFGLTVRESHSALIAVKDGEAHAVLIPESSVFLTANRDRLCHPVSSARLDRSHVEGFWTPIAGLHGE